jgi:hypothetical protein
MALLVKKVDSLRALVIVHPLAAGAQRTPSASQRWWQNVADPRLRPGSFVNLAEMVNINAVRGVGAQMGLHHLGPECDHDRSRRQACQARLQRLSG